MEWISVKDRLPEEDERVIVWIKYDGEDHFEWTDSELDSPDNPYYIEPNSKRGWLMGSAKYYKITHWAYIEPPQAQD